MVSLLSYASPSRDCPLPPLRLRSPPPWTFARSASSDTNVAPVAVRGSVASSQQPRNGNSSHLKQAIRLLSCRRYIQYLLRGDFTLSDHATRMKDGQTCSPSFQNVNSGDEAHTLFCSTPFPRGRRRLAWHLPKFSLGHSPVTEQKPASI